MRSVGLASRSLMLILAIVVPTVAWSLGHREEVRWHLDPHQAAAWLATLPENPDLAPSASVKVAVAPEVSVTGVEILEPVWRDEPWDGTAPADVPVVRLGARSSWHGVPFQEILISPIQPSPNPHQVRILESCSLRLLPTTEYEPEVMPGVPSGTGDLASFANPLRAAELRASRAQVRQAPTTQAPEAVTPKGRISVSQDGIYRLTYSYLTSAGINPSTWTVANIHVTCRGVEIPILIEGSALGTFGSSNAIVFYGQKLKITNRNVWNGGDFTDTNVYWLYADATPGLRMTSKSATPPLIYTPATSFPCTMHFESNDIIDTYDHFRPNGDEWFWRPYLHSPLNLTVNPPETDVAHSVTLPHPYGSGFSVTAVLAGLRAFTHGVSITVNGAAPTTGGSPATWSGKTLGTLAWTFSSGLPSSGSSTVVLPLAVVPGQDDYAYLDYLEFTYNRAFTADSNTLFMTPPNASATYQCSPFSSAPYILDVSRQDSSTGLALPQNLTGASNLFLTCTFQMPADASITTGRAVSLSSAPLTPDAASMSSGTDLSSTSLGCNLLIITHPDFHPSGGDAVWQQYLTRRQASMSVMAVDVQDVFDSFSNGLFDPTAIQTFLGVAATHWNPVPKYVLLIGDGTYDYKNGMQVSGAKNRVPTMMFDDVDDSTYLGRYPSDAWFADVDGSGFPEMAVGRIPAHGYTELAGVLTKLMAYEDQALTGSWYKTQFYIADTYTQAWEQEFETFNNSLIAAYGAPPWAHEQVYYHAPPFNGTDATACAAAIRAAWPNSALIHFDGHSGLSTWGFNTIFSIGDVGLLAPVTLPPSAPFAPLPFVVNSSCYNSAFDEVSTSIPVVALMETMILRGDGGSVGSCGFSTIAFPSDEESFNSAIYAQIFGKSKTRKLGDAVEVGRFALPSTNARDVMGNILLGDPTLSLRLPAPLPPSLLGASGGNASVSLTWSPANPAPASYNAYRSADGGSTWTLANGAPISGSPYLDPGLINGQPYSYYLTSVDASGFEGAPSPVASATPLNPLPPQVPTGLKAVDNGTGAAALVSWNANTESDLSGYTLAWGTASGSYTSSLSIGKGTTSTLVQGLVSNSTYYFAVAAKNTSGLQSAYSAEASCKLTGQLMAITPPGLIVDLKVTRSGQDLVLAWSKPATNLGGTPSDVASFQIYRVAGIYNWNLDTVSQAAPNALINVPAVSGQTAYTYTDAGAMTLSNPLTYLVVAVSSSGLRSPASNYPPAAILDLRLSRGSLGSTLLTFSPVVLNTAGQTVAGISAYRVYGFYPATKASDQVNPTSPVFVATLPPSLPPCSGTAVYCDVSVSQPLNYTVVAVDNRGNTSLY